MSKISKAVTNMQGENILQKSNIVTNFMGGDSYTVDPLMKLRMVTASSIFGEPAYYRVSKLSGNKGADRAGAGAGSYGVTTNFIRNDVRDLLKAFDIIHRGENEDTATLMERVIDEALDYDFKGTLEWAVELRKNYFIRLNPQVIMVRAAMHPKRAQFTEEYNGAFNDINQQVMFRADDPLSQLSYFLYKNDGQKNAIPSILKRSWAAKISGLNRYQMAKYKNHEIGMINAVRICHAKGELVNELMQTGTIEVTEDEETWERMRSAGKTWEEIFKNVKMGHMALLRNMRNFLTEVSDYELVKVYMEAVKSGVAKGKQFPFRYYSAYRAIKEAPQLNHKQFALDTLEECMDIALDNLPRIKGRVMCLSDNSGSAWGTITTEYGSVVIAEIDNLSSVITAMRADEGYVGIFGDRLDIHPISKRRGVLEQAMELSKFQGRNVGLSTEGGIWEFFRDATRNNEHWDSIFIYSDQQAGTGGLYGTDVHYRQYCDEYSLGHNINVFKLVLDYRKRVNSKVNVFSVQTAGYDNMVIPQYAYRTNLMHGWTGKEAIFADTMIKLWDEVEAEKNRKHESKGTKNRGRKHDEEYMDKHSKTYNYKKPGYAKHKSEGARGERRVKPENTARKPVTADGRISVNQPKTDGYKRADSSKTDGYKRADSSKTSGYKRADSSKTDGYKRAYDPSYKKERASGRTDSHSAGKDYSKHTDGRVGGVTRTTHKPRG